MSNDNVGVAAAASPTNYIDNEAIATGGSPATVDRQRVRLGGLGYTELADVVAGDTGQSGLVVHNSRKQVTFTTTTNQAVGSTDISNYRSVSVQFTTFGGGTATFQGSNDNSTWNNVALITATTTGSSAAVVSAAALGMYHGSTSYRYFRINVTGISGTVAGTIEFGSMPISTFGVGGVISGSVTASGAVAAGDAQNNAFPLAVALQGYNGASWDRLRTATKFATVEATASGDTAVYTPTTSKKFRLLAYSIDVTADAATSGGADVTFVLRDATTALGMGATVFCPSAAGTTFGSGYSSGWRTVDNGPLSAAANNVLNINLSAALSAGKCRVNVALCEE